MKLRPTNAATLFILKLLAIAAIINISGCTTGEADPTEIIDYGEVLEAFEQHYQRAQPDIIRWSANQSDNFGRSTSNSSKKTSSEFIGSLASPSLSLLRDFGFTDEDFEEMFGTSNISEISEGLVGAAILLYSLQKDNYGDDSKQDGDFGQNRAVFCFMEATGLAAGAAIVGALIDGASGKALRKAFKKLLKKVGAKAVSGIGLILIAAEFTWCMTRSVNEK